MRILFSFIFLLLAYPSLAQDDCEISLSGIEASELKYEGECKRGRAHGEGVVKFKDLTLKGDFKRGEPDENMRLETGDGNVYELSFDGGKIYGEGKLLDSEGEVVEQGYYKGTIDNFRYTGKEESSLLGYKILNKDNLNEARINFSKRNDDSNRITIQISDAKNRSLSRVNITERTTGEVAQFTETNSRVFLDLTSMTFPFKGTLRYSVSNASGNFDLMAILKFEITESGYWDIRITH